jgi:hypothetical protein
MKIGMITGAGARHRVAAADLLLVQSRVRETIERLVPEHDPDVVGLSVMTFQRKTAKGIIDLVRARPPHAHIVVGGYDPSLAPEAYTEGPDRGVDFRCCEGRGRLPETVKLFYRKSRSRQHRLNSIHPITRLMTWRIGFGGLQACSARRAMRRCSILALRLWSRCEHHHSGTNSTSSMKVTRPHAANVTST